MPTGPSLLELIVQFAGLFPNLEYLELPDAMTDDNGYIPPVVDVLRQHCPQVQKLKIGRAPVVEVGRYGQSGSGDAVNVS